MHKENNVIISIIVPIYNMEKYLPKCLESILSQTFKNIEIICINDGSTDESLNILQEYKNKDNRIKIISQDNQGLSAARNVGLDIAIGQYIGFVDSDDYICPNMFEELYNSIIKYNTDISMCNFYKEKNNTLQPFSFSKSILINYKYSYIYELLRNNIYGDYVWSRLYKKNIFNDVRFRVGRVFEDIYLSCDLLDKINSVYYIEKPLYYYCSRENSISNKMCFNSIIDAVDAFYKRYCIIKEKYKELTDINVFSMLRWLCYMRETTSNDELFFNKFNITLKDVTNDSKYLNLDIFEKETYSNKVQKLIEDYNNRINDNK